MTGKETYSCPLLSNENWLYRLCYMGVNSYKNLSTLNNRFGLVQKNETFYGGIYEKEQPSGGPAKKRRL